jgi:hypothetical protein
MIMSIGVSKVMNLMGLLGCEEGRRWLMIMSTGCQM